MRKTKFGNAGRCNKLIKAPKSHLYQRVESCHGLDYTMRFIIPALCLTLTRMFRLYRPPIYIFAYQSKHSACLFTSADVCWRLLIIFCPPYFILVIFLNMWACICVCTYGCTCAYVYILEWIIFLFLFFWLFIFFSVNNSCFQKPYSWKRRKWLAILLCCRWKLNKN